MTELSRMKLSDFDYAYPEELVAQHPLPERSASRMMVVSRSERSWRHARVAGLGEWLRAGDLLVLNDSRVVPARLFGKRADGQALEILVVEPAAAAGGSAALWRCLMRRARQLKPGERIAFGGDAWAYARGTEEAYLLLEFEGEMLDRAIARHGVPPLPPYIRRRGRDAYTDEDRERYQTVYARHPGSAAAPTGGLHLSEGLLAGLSAQGIATAAVTLHVGIDTFTPVRVEEVDAHRMHGERIEIPEATAAAVACAKEEGRRVIAVGTTTVRALESAASPAPECAAGFAWSAGAIRAGRWTTDLFLRPGAPFRAVDALLTNFHQPRSTLLMMVAAFAGRDFILSCYAEAIREQYRLFSFGDCMLIV